MSAATLEDVLKWRAVVERPSVSHARGWGPVLKDAAHAHNSRNERRVTKVKSVHPDTRKVKLEWEEKLPRVSRPLREPQHPAALTVVVRVAGMRDRQRADESSKTSVRRA